MTRLWPACVLGLLAIFGPPWYFQMRRPGGGGRMMTMTMTMMMMMMMIRYIVAYTKC